jgi:hypothetical protein
MQDETSNISYKWGMLFKKLDIQEQKIHERWSRSPSDER